MFFKELKNTGKVLKGKVMTQLYKKNGSVFIPVGLTLEEVEKLIEKRVEHIQEFKKQTEQNKKETVLNPDYFSGRW